MDTGFCVYFKHSYDYLSALKHLIDPSRGRLTELSVGDDPYRYSRDRDDAILMGVLAAPSSLKVLKLHHFDSPLSHFERNTCLIKLVVNDTNYFSQVGAICSVLKHNRTLHYLELNTPLLHYLELNTPGVGDFVAAVKSFNHAIKTNSTLLVLEFRLPERYYNRCELCDISLDSRIIISDHVVLY